MSLTMAWDNAPRQIDPRFLTDADSQYLENLTHCSLFRFDETGQTVPYLARDFKWLTPTRLKITLQNNIQFSDGSNVTADDVVETYSFFKKTKLKIPSPRAGAFSNIQTIRKISTDELEFILQKPDAPMLTNLIVGILPKEVANLPEPFLKAEKEIQSCGPFVLNTQTFNELHLRKNPFYKLTARGNLTDIYIKIVRDETTRSAKLKKKEIEFLQNLLPREVVKKLETKTETLKVEKTIGINTAYLGFNFKDPVLKNIAVRRAISMSLRRADIVKFGLQGYATLATTLLTPGSAFFNKSLPSLDFDLEKAKSVLKNSGIDLIKSPISLTLKTTTNTTRVVIAKSIASQLRKLGFQVTVETSEWGKFKADIEAGRVQMWMLNWVGFKDPDIFRYAFATESFPPAGANRGWFENAKIDTLLQSGRSEMDLKKRKDIYNEVQLEISKIIPYVFLWHEDVIAVMQKSIKKFQVAADGNYFGLTFVDKG